MNIGYISAVRSSEDTLKLFGPQVEEADVPHVKSTQLVAESTKRESIYVQFFSIASANC